MEELNVRLRELIEAVRTSDVPAEDLQKAEDLVRQATVLVDAHKVEEMRMQAALRFDALDERMQKRAAGVDRFTDPDISATDIFPYSPVVGALNPISAPVQLRVVDGEPHRSVVGTGVFPSAHNGPPDSVHGGIIAAAFDELLGFLCVANDLGGFTGTLTVVYRSTTPIERTIDFEGTIDRIEGRKVFAKGVTHHDGTLLAEAEGIFIRAALVNDMGSES